MGFIGPIGVTNEHLGNNQIAKIFNYFWRIAILNNLIEDHNPIKDPSNLVSYYEFAARICKDIGNRSLLPKFKMAFGLDLAAGIEMLSEDQPLKLFLATNDKLFTLDEYRESLGDELYLKTVIEIVGSHSPLVSKMGKKQLVVSSN